MILAAHAGLAKAADVQGLLAVQSDKIVRGFSQSGGAPVLVADGLWRADAGWQLNAGLATLGHQHPRGTAELTLGAGYGAAWNEAAAWHFSHTRYVRLGAAAAPSPGYGEWAASLNLWGQFSALLLLAPDYPGPPPGSARGRVWSTEASWHQPLASGWSMDAGIGRSHYTGGLVFSDYGYGSLGLSWRRGRLQGVVGRIFNTSGAGSHTVVASVLWRL